MKKLFLLLTAVIFSIDLAFCETSQVTYLDENGNRKNTYAVYIYEDQSEPVVWSAGTYFVATSVTFSGGLSINGQVRLIINDGATFTVYNDNDGMPGIYVGSSSSTSFTLYSGIDRTGHLVVEGGKYAAGIGGAQGESGNNIHLYGCYVLATGGEGASGIGGGKGASASSDILVGEQYTIKDKTAGDPGTVIFYNNDEDVAAKLARKKVIELDDRCQYNVNYVDQYGTAHVVSRAAMLENTSVPTNWKAGWYVVSGNVTLSQGAICHGAVNLILSDGAKLTVNSENDEAGIRVSGVGNSLTIYGQTNQSGQLSATGGGIHAAAIGGGNGQDASNIRIYGGTLAVQGGDYGAGIGAGYRGQASDIYVGANLIMMANNYNPPSTVIIPTDNDIADLLAGQCYVTTRIRNTCTVTLDPCHGSGGTTQVQVAEYAAMPTISIPTREWGTFMGYFTEKHGRGTQYYLADGTSARVLDIEDATTTLYAHWTLTVPYIDEDGTQQMVTSIMIEDATEQLTLTAGWYVTIGEVTLSEGALCDGAVHLILADGAKLTAATGSKGYAGIQVSGTENSLTIYGQTGQSGQLIATGGVWAAGIGSGMRADGSNITINGGVITATGGDNGAGIGGGFYGSGKNITFNGGKVTATGGNSGAGIGGGRFGSSEYITFNGGEINAIGVGSAAGIGNGGSQGSNAHFYFNGGKVFITAGMAVIGSIDGELPDIHFDNSMLLRVGDDNPPQEIVDYTKEHELRDKLTHSCYAVIEPVIRVAAHYEYTMNANFCTFYGGAQAYDVVTDGVTLYTASLETYGSDTYLNLNKIEGHIVPANTPVIIRADLKDGWIPREEVLLLPYTDSTDDIVVPANSLSGTDVDLTVAANTVYTLAAQLIDDIYTMGFYLFSGTTIPAHKAYLQLEPGQSVPRRICFGTSSVGTATGIQNANANANANKYIRDGQLYIEREGRIYNVQGAEVK